MAKRALIIAMIVACAGVASVHGQGGQWFSGSWDAQIHLAPQEIMPFSSFQSSLDVGLRLGFVEFSSISDFLIDGWLWQELALEVNLLPMSFDGIMLLEPQSGSFLYAQGVLSLEFPPIRCSLYAAMTGATQSGSVNYGYVFDLTGEILPGALGFRSSTFLGADLSGITFNASSIQTDSSLITKTYLTDPTIELLPAAFSGQEIALDALLLGCIDISSVTTFGTMGFISEHLEVSFLHLFGLPLNIGLELTFETQTKSFVFTPSLDTRYGCLDIYSNVLGSGGTITGIEIYGIAFSATIGNATLSSISNLDTTEYVITTPEFGSIVESLADATASGHLYYPQDYWEIVSLVVDIPPAGCGFSFSVETFFSTSDGMLFDWAKSTMGITLALGDSVSTSTSITVDTSGFTSWGVSFSVAW